MCQQKEELFRQTNELDTVTLLSAWEFGPPQLCLLGQFLPAPLPPPRASPSPGGGPWGGLCRVLPGQWHLPLTVFLRALFWCKEEKLNSNLHKMRERIDPHFENVWLAGLSHSWVQDSGFCSLFLSPASLWVMPSMATRGLFQAPYPKERATLSSRQRISVFRNLLIYPVRLMSQSWRITVSSQRVTVMQGVRQRHSQMHHIESPPQLWEDQTSAQTVPGLECEQIRYLPRAKAVCLIIGR